jgi:hypothetical protein
MAEVSVFAGGQVVATTSVPDGTQYRIVLHAGTYVLSTSDDPRSGRRVSVTAGTTVHMDIPNECR